MSISIILLLSGSILLQGKVLPVVAQDTNVKIESGMTVIYDINRLNYSKELLNQFLSAANISIVPKSSLAGSELYVKILNVHKEAIPVTDFASQQVVTTDGVVVDIEMGLIVSEDTTFEINGTDFVIPKGTGFNIPFVFGTVTDFIIPSGNSTLLPLPLVLSQDWLSHESTLSLFSDYVDISNTNDYFNVSIALDNSQIINMKINGDISWRKSDGLLLKLDLTAYNMTNNELILDLSINMKSTERLTTGVKTGDYYSLVLNKTTADSTISDKTIQQLYDQLVGNLSQAEGSAVLAFKVESVDGLYYEIRPLTLNVTTGELVEGNSTWLSSFGKYPQGLTLNAATLLLNNNASLDPNTPIRDQVILGPFATPDWDIYKTWDASSSLMLQPIVDQLMSFLQRSGFAINLGNITLGAPKSLSLSTSGGSQLNSTHYTSSTEFVVTQDLTSTNFTQTIGSYNVTPTTKILLQTGVSMDLAYALGDTPYLETVKLQTSFSLVLSTEVNGIKINATIAQITITNLMKGHYVPATETIGIENETKVLLGLLGILAGISGIGAGIVVLLRRGA